MFLPGDSIVVLGGLRVTKLSDTLWAIDCPDGETTTVAEDAEAPAGYDGERFAVSAVLDAEQTADLADVAAA